MLFHLHSAIIRSSGGIKSHDLFMSAAVLGIPPSIGHYIGNPPAGLGWRAFFLPLKTHQALSQAPSTAYWASPCWFQHCTP